MDIILLNMLKKTGFSDLLQCRKIAYDYFDELEKYAIREDFSIIN